MIHETILQRKNIIIVMIRGKTYYLPLTFTCDTAFIKAPESIFHDRQRDTNNYGVAKLLQSSYTYVIQLI